MQHDKFQNKHAVMIYVFRSVFGPGDMNQETDHLIRSSKRKETDEWI